MALKSAFRAVLRVADNSGSMVPWPPSASEAKWDGYWDAFAGGKLDMKETKYTPYDEEQRVYAGIKEQENYTLDSDYIIDLHGPLIAEWEPGNTTGNFAGADLRGRKCEVIIQEKDSGGNWQQNRPTSEGQVISIAYPDGDSNDAQAIDKISLVVSVGKPAGQGGVN